MTSDERIRQAIERARSLVAEEEEPYRSLAFQTLLESFLGQGQEQQRAEAPVIASGAPRAARMGKSINEFLAEVKPRSHFDRVVAIAYHHYSRGNPQGITLAEIVDAYRSSREKRPQNFYDVIRKLVRKGLLVDAPKTDEGKNAWVITPSGEAAVQAGFEPNGQDRVR